MKWPEINLKCLRGICAGLFAALVLAGCASSPESGPEQAGTAPFRFPGQEPIPVVTPPVGQGPAPRSPAVLLGVGELITVSFSDLPPPGLPDHKERIREDGKITLPYNVTVLAAGKTAGKLQQDIRNEYVPKFFVNLTVTVKTEERVFFVGGEVKNPGRQYYSGEMTVLRGVQSAGGFTDFADRTRIEITRSSGQKFKVNWKKAIKDSKLDLPVFPNDLIDVRKKRW